MKAILWEKYGNPKGLRLREVDKPSPKDDELLVKIYATTVTAGDTEMRGLKFSKILNIMLRLYLGIFKPRKKILGQELSGTVVEKGLKVTTFEIGDQIIASTGLKFGSYAEYICINPSSEMMMISKKPSNLTMLEAAALPVAGLEAAHYIKLSALKKGEHILINGAAGSFGTFAIQLAKYYGAIVTAVDSKDKFDVLNQVGADFLIDYQTEDFTNQINHYDVIFDIVSNSPFKKSLESLKEGGRYIFATPKASYKNKKRFTNLGSKKVLFDLRSHNNSDLENIITLSKEVKLIVIIDSVRSIEDIPEAHSYIEAGLKKGHLLIQVEKTDE